jgi:hypothetical protein
MTTNIVLTPGFFYDHIIVLSDLVDSTGTTGFSSLSGLRGSVKGSVDSYSEFEQRADEWTQ